MEKRLGKAQKGPEREEEGSHQHNGKHLQVRKRIALREWKLSCCRDKEMLRKARGCKR